MVLLASGAIETSCRTPTTIEATTNPPTTTNAVAIAGTTFLTTAPASAPRATPSTDDAANRNHDVTKFPGCHTLSATPTTSNGCAHPATDSPRTAPPTATNAPSIVTAARSQRVRPVAWEKANRYVPDSISRATSGAPTKTPTTTGRISSTTRTVEIGSVMLATLFEIVGHAASIGPATLWSAT
ncbi:MAG: hypothetical protein M0Z33_04280 [Actinomycetota bacterium]|nr:hypothetical protein [Actinomycetota bacterium]